MNYSVINMFHPLDHLINFVSTRPKDAVITSIVAAGLFGVGRSSLELYGKYKRGVTLSTHDKIHCSLTISASLLANAAAMSTFLFDGKACSYHRLPEFSIMDLLQY